MKVPNALALATGHALAAVDPAPEMTYDKRIQIERQKSKEVPEELGHNIRLMWQMWQMRQMRQIRNFTLYHKSPHINTHT